MFQPSIIHSAALKLTSMKRFKINVIAACCGVYISATLIFWQSGLYPSIAQGYGNGYGYGYEDNDVADSQRNALMNFYREMGGAEWLNSDGWIRDLHHCSWFGVSCLDGFVSKISLQSNNLSGELSTALASIITLKDLDLSGNLISGQLPSEITKLASLQNLDLSGNKLSGSVPDKLNQLRLLRSLILDRNRFSGPLPDLNQNFLEIINLSENYFNGPLRETYLRLPELRELNLNKNLIDGNLPSIDLVTSKLSILSLSGNQITGKVPAKISVFASLEILRLNGNQLSGEVPSEVLSLPRLKELQLANNDFLGKPLFPQVANGQLVIVNLSSNNFSGEFPAALFNHKNLERLEIDRNKFSGEIPTQLSGLTRLKVLNLANNNFYGSFPEVSNLGSLSVLNLANNRFFSPLPNLVINGSIEWVDTSEALNKLPSIEIETAITPVIDSDGMAGEIFKLAGKVTPGDGPVVAVRWYSNTDLVSENLLDSVKLGDGLIALQLEAVDDLGQTASSDTTIQINAPVYPTVRIANGLSRYPDTDGKIGEHISLSGLGEDLDGSIVSYIWSVDGVKISEGSDAKFALENGSATISVTVTDNVGLSATQTLETFVEPPVYAPSKTWPQAFNGTYPDDSFGLSLNNVGIVESDTGIWRTCINVLNADGTRSNQVLDANFKILSIEQGRIQLTDIRPFNPFGSFTDYLEEPDCSGSYDATSNTYTDYIAYGASIYTVSFLLENLDKRIFLIESFQQLEVEI